MLKERENDKNQLHYHQQHERKTSTKKEEGKNSRKPERNEGEKVKEERHGSNDQD